MRRIILSAGVLLGLACTATRPLAGNESPATVPGELASLIAAAADQPPDPEQTLATARQRLTASIERLEQFLAGGEVTNSGRWRSFLDLPRLRTELDRQQPDVAALRSMQERYYKNHQGLELPVFLAVRRDLGGFLAALQYATASSPPELYRGRLEELETCLATADGPAAADVARAGEIVEWLAPLGDSGEKVASAVREHYCRVNGTAQVSRQFINLLLAQNVEERNFISDMVLGSYTQGVAYTQGQVSFDTIPNAQRGTLEVKLEGLTACPDTVAQRRRVSVYSSAQTVIRASKQVQISDLGFSLFPAVASAATSVQIGDVEARSRIVERISWRRANQLVPQAEEAASQRAGAEASSKLDQQANASLGGMHDVFCQQIRAPLVRLGALPKTLQFWSDASHLRLALAQHSEFQLAPASVAPQLPADYDLAGCMHETLIANFCESLLGGATINDQAWLDLMDVLTGTSPRPLWVHDRAERWSVSLAKERPIDVRFAEDRIGINFRLAGVTRGTKKFELPVEIGAQFLPKITADGPAFIRQGELEVRFADRADFGQEAELRKFLEKKFGAVLPPELHLDGLVPPTGGSLGKLRQLELVEFSARRGWLAVGYQLVNRADGRTPLVQR